MRDIESMLCGAHTALRSVINALETHIDEVTDWGVDDVINLLRGINERLDEAMIQALVADAMKEDEQE